MRLLVGASTGIMLVGFLAVMSVIAYRVVKQEPPAAPAGEVARLVLDAAPGARITGLTADGGAVFVLVEAPGGSTAVHAYDAATLRLRAVIAPAP